jgi:hypothetical protein
MPLMSNGSRLNMRSPNRTHDRSSFFKYMPASTALLVLKNRSLRWSSPELFNDPFDVPRELSFGIQPEQLAKASADRIAHLIQNPPESTTHLSPSLQLIVEAVKRGISEDLKKALIDGLKEEGDKHKPSGASMEAMRQMWRSTLSNFRILCLTETPAHASMWHHYADQYRGVVIEVQCVDELDSAWLIAKPVAYPKDKPLIYTAEGWAELLALRHDLAIQKILELATYTKSLEWDYEKEWRITSSKRPHDVGLHSDWKFHQDEVSGIYFGPRISPEDRVAVESAATAYAKAKLWNVSIGMSRELLIAETGS